MPRFLIVTAAPAERDAIVRGLPSDRQPAAGIIAGYDIARTMTAAGLIDVIVAGVGPVAAAVATAAVLTHGYDLVFSAGIAGGFSPIEAGELVVASAVVQADLGAETADGFRSMADLGWGEVRFELDGTISGVLAHRARAETGEVLSVSTVTGTQRRADELRERHPDAKAEAMEGIGVYAAARSHGAAFAEVRAISNSVGPRDRDNWHIEQALERLGAGFDLMLAAPLKLPVRVTASPSQ